MNNLPWLLIVICWIVRYDPDQLARSPIRDRMACVSEAALLGLVGFITAASRSALSFCSMRRSAPPIHSPKAFYGRRASGALGPGGARSRSASA
jgi:hypothetical protein